MKAITALLRSSYFTAVVAGGTLNFAAGSFVPVLAQNASNACLNSINRQGQTASEDCLRRLEVGTGTDC